MTQKNESYQFQFNFDQTLWATALLLKKIGRDVHYLDLARLLYLVEREYLSGAGEMLMGGAIHAMKHGPVLERVFLLIKGCDIWKSDEWARHIRILPKTHFVRLIHFPENFHLWRDQIECLHCVVNYYYGDNKTDLGKLVRSLPEWKKYKPAKTEEYQIIPWEEILRARGQEELIERVNTVFQVCKIVDEAFAKNRLQNKSQ
ncbi:MAG: Panacea domain-containing protein [Planctomycetaceae bacterium]|nr:Panacea domain-containing protein [Planctomycetaceae bacterium]